MSERETTYTAAQHEREMTRMEVQADRWRYAFLIVLCMLFISNAGWALYELFVK